MGSCSFGFDKSSDPNNGGCVKFWHRLQRVQIAAVVLAGVVSCAGPVFSSMTLIDSRIFVQNSPSRGDYLCYSHANEGEQ